MIVNKRELKQTLNRVYLKIKPDTETIQVFQANLTRLLEQCDSKKSEEFNKNLLIDFLKNTYYTDRYFINTKERIDLVIHNNQDVKSPVGVIFETKKPSRTINAEMPRLDHLNTKAFQQLVLYFLRERVTDKNLDIKHLIVTNIYEWFIFDGKIFEELFFANKALVKQFCDFEAGRLSSTKTDFFYQQIAEPAITKVIEQIKFTHFDLRELENLDWLDIYKILSPEHLLKLPFVNDSNTLNKPFYNELLYIIGLTEVKDKGKKLIGRMKEGDRCDGSLIENAISRLDSLDKIAQLKNPEEFGTTNEERLFNVALRLSINWINRVLFLKLLEAQLIKYHQGDRDFAFLNLAKVPSYDDLDSLFFDVLARETNKREAKVKTTFAYVPYLNSSLFEPTETEQQTIVIGNLRERTLPIFTATVLKDNQGNKRVGELNSLAYLFEFLDAYKFDRDELENPQEDSEKLINASVLGLIFEKINGYKDGSFYTPSFITMYMCRETIRRAIVQKFNEVKGWNCQTLDDLYERIEDKKEANTIINSLKICDPAVGSGHFLVSALNEIIAIKSELRVLLDTSGKSLKDYRVEVRNDKLLVYDDEGTLFAYHPNNKEKQRVQQALFHEKQTIIEGCLFGVDINPNSVTICRLRLWIELLKNAYYREDGNLETLPNIDINIKCGNSLISRFALDVDVRQVLQKQKFSIEEYRNAVQTYRNAETKEQKRQMETLIAKIKAGFSANLLIGDPKKVKLRQLQGELYNLENQGLLFEETKTEQKAREKKVTKLNNEIDKLTAEIADIESGRLYDNALEWRFEFPEVLNDDGDFVGFDVVIGNPPYIRQEDIKELKTTLQKSYQCYTGVADLFVYFYELGLNLLKPQGHLTYISSNKYFRAGYGEKLRQLLGDSTTIYNLIDFGDFPVFEEAIAYPSIITLSKNKSENNQLQALSWDETKKQDIARFATVLEQDGLIIAQENLKPDGWRLESSQILDLLAKLRNAGKSLGEYVEGRFYRGILTGFNEAFVIDRATRDRLINEHPSSAEVIKPFLRGRDVKRWCVDFAEQYLIKIESSENKEHPWSKLSEQEAEKIFDETYPAIYKHFSQFRKSLIKRCDQGRFFWELRSCIYWQEFEQPKIIYPNICKRNEFAWDELGYYTNQKAFIISSSDKVLLAVLNSNVVMFLFKNLLSKLQGDFYEPSSIFMKDFPIPNATESQRTAIEKLVQKCLDAKKDDPTANTSELEKQIDHLVYKLYQLTYNEVKIIDPEFALTEQEYLDLP
ncbi:MAG: class I SAM-dependent DNA methyltransferase [Microcystis wesenbergii Mw_QC_S_20081001_S30D]|uniref:site-specific DNA-methyltransferase (adenine-specific) n=1 Tax=Microcystis wesenbergii Mw_QC_S_20081001_S30D TaxID=2486245 RepID=A0A552JED0_9CHRO|nr:MAG: class I SAM-dependent DNA methyltransferase [Microcystis wesenbergii Mw_QC_S_20081001_S30D]TRV04556.1 MAG: class I SAM-dependent DNA methyltransferase [Microcystis wesenbergii Mw_QC_S_20081001_S30]